jgi:ABC-type Mn2+/Zn2+ transport system permease subunit
VAYACIQSCLTANRAKTTSSTYESALLARLAAASLLSLALSHKQLKAHKNLGFERRDGEYARMLRTFVFANATAASIQLCGAIIVSSLLLAGRSTSTQLRHSIFIASFRLPSLQNLICTRPALLHSCCVTFLSTLIGFGVDSSS